MRVFVQISELCSADLRPKLKTPQECIPLPLFFFRVLIRVFVKLFERITYMMQSLLSAKAERGTKLVQI